MMMRLWWLPIAALLSAGAVLADPPPATAPPYRPSSGALIPVAIYDAQGNIVGSFGGSSASAPTFTTPAGVTRTRLTCTLPAYASGGNIVCTDSAGAQTTTACVANTACLVSAANAARKTALVTVRTAGVTCDVGYSATVAPGNAVGIDGSATAGGQGGSLNETPAHVGAYYAACPSAATVVLVQGQ